MAGKVSKNQRTATSSSKTPAGNVYAGESKIIISANGGRNAYVRTVDGTMPNLSTSGEAFLASVRSIAAAGHGDRVRAEIDALVEAHPGSAWKAVRDQLEQADAFAA